MVKSRSKSPRKSRSKSPRKSRSKSPKVYDFMKKSVISPMLRNREDNYPISHESHASHASHPSHPSRGMDNDKPVSYHSPNDYDSNDDNEGNISSSDESYLDGENNDMIIPSEETYANTTRKKDLKIYRMKDLLDKKKKIMFEKENEIKELGKQNSFLETVVHDYENYNTVILDEKIKQKKALKILSQHIREISKNIRNDDFKLNRVKMDQTLLLEEIQNIRDEIEYVFKSNGRNNVYMSSDDEYNDDSEISSF
jgi:hypothetical protein